MGKWIGRLLALAVLATWLYFAYPELTRSAAIRFLGDSSGESHSIVTLLPPDAIPSIDSPEFYAPSDADREYEPDELVLGVEFEGDARAYSLDLLSTHEIVNDVVGDQPIAVTWCPVCYTAIVYSRTVEGHTLEFGVSGKLVMNALVMYDRQTNSLWAQVTGQSIEGPMAGAELEFLPSWMTTWADWRARHPHTLALVKGYAGQRDPYAGYFFSPKAGVTRQARRDGRLPGKQRVIGVATGEGAMAYPYDVLEDEMVVNDWIGSTPVLVVFDAENRSGAVFDRRVDGRTLTFQINAGLQLVDGETGSVWAGMEGRGLSGELQGRELVRLRSTPSFWFGWKDYYPDTGVHGID